MVVSCWKTHLIQWWMFMDVPASWTTRGSQIRVSSLIKHDFTGVSHITGTRIYLRHIWFLSNESYNNDGINWHKLTINTGDVVGTQCNRTGPLKPENTMILFSSFENRLYIPNQMIEFEYHIPHQMVSSQHAPLFATVIWGMVDSCWYQWTHGWLLRSEITLW